MANLEALLAAHRTLGKAPHEEHAWLIAHGEFRHYDGGLHIASKGGTVNEMMVMFTGTISVHLEGASGHKHLFEFHAGDVSGILPYSRVTSSIGEIIADEPTDVLAVHRDHFPELVRECPVVTATVVHVMLDRARTFVASDWQDEKMASLGRLAAGMAHELNNPASATARSAKLLGDALKELEDSSIALGELELSDVERARITAMRDVSLVPTATGVFSAIERADLEDDVSDWLAAHGADDRPAASLTEIGVTGAMLDDLTEGIAGPTLDAALRWIAAAHNARSLAKDIERAGGRIYDLVSAVKRFSHMDRAAAMAPTNIAEGVADTVSVMAGKARSKDVAVHVEIATGLPKVPAFAGELNQVWSNLLDNAVDAVNPSGHVTVSVTQEGPDIVVRVTDDGAGIPDDVRKRIFDPFFTTKGVGQGSGLGLDIARRIVRLHNGQILVDSRPGRTEFKVAIPIAASAA